MFVYETKFLRVFLNWCFPSAACVVVQLSGSVSATVRFFHQLIFQRCFDGRCLPVVSHMKRTCGFLTMPTSTHIYRHGGLWNPPWFSKYISHGVRQLNCYVGLEDSVVRCTLFPFYKCDLLPCIQLRFLSTCSIVYTAWSWPKVRTWYTHCMEECL